VSSSQRFVTNATKRPSPEMVSRIVMSGSCAPMESRLTRSVAPVRRSWTKASGTPFVSPGTRFVAELPKTTNRPSAESAGPPLAPLGWVPTESTLIRSVVPVMRSRTKMSSTPFVSPGTRFVARLPNATNRPSAEIAGDRLSAFPWTPAESTLTRWVTCARAAGGEQRDAEDDSSRRLDHGGL
jgi:hypothetical protein